MVSAEGEETRVEGGGTKSSELIKANSERARSVTFEGKTLLRRRPSEGEGVGELLEFSRRGEDGIVDDDSRRLDSGAFPSSSIVDRDDTLGFSDDDA